MIDSQLIIRHPELKELIHCIRHEIQQAQRPADEIIMDDEDVMRTLKICKRTLQYMKSGRVIPFHYFDPESPRCYYLLSDLLDILKKNRVEALSDGIRIK